MAREKQFSQENKAERTRMPLEMESTVSFQPPPPPILVFRQKELEPSSFHLCEHEVEHSGLMPTY